jgi:hypothetical protein
MHKSAIRPGSNFNRQGGSIFHQRQQPDLLTVAMGMLQRMSLTTGRFKPSGATRPKMLLDPAAYRRLVE